MARITIQDPSISNPSPIRKERIEIVLCEPGKYFPHRQGATSGMACFDIAKKTLPAIGFDCPIWLVMVKW